VRVYRFVVGPEKIVISYKPVATFRDRVRIAASRFLEDHGLWPNACYVSARFPGPTPGPLFLSAGELGEMVGLNFRRQTLLAEGEVLLGVEVEAELGGEGDGEFDERAVG
jgi:hypothetical protein